MFAHCICQVYKVFKFSGTLAHTFLQMGQLAGSIKMLLIEVILIKKVPL